MGLETLRRTRKQQIEASRPAPRRPACRHLGDLVEAGPVEGLRSCLCPHPGAPKLAAPDDVPLTRDAPDKASCASCPLRADPGLDLKWLVAVQACRRPQRQTIDRTLKTLALAGWPEPIVFWDGPLEEEARRRILAKAAQWGAPDFVVRGRPAGALASFGAIAAELAAREPEAAHLIVQDDVALSANVRQYLDARGWPRDAVLLKLFAPDETIAAAAEPGWTEIPEELHMRGAQALLFPPGELERLVASPHILNQRRGLIRGSSHRTNEAIDNVVARWAREAGGRQYVHNPSLAQHTAPTADNSALGHVFPEASSWRGERFDCLAELPGRPLVTCVLVTGKPGRRELARQSVLAFARQTYQPRELLVINDGRARLLDKELREELGAGLTLHELRPQAGLTLGELRNLGIENARGRLVAQWDDDDFCTPDRLAAQIAAWRPGAAVCLRRQLRADLHRGEHPIVFDRPSGIEGTIVHEASTRHRYPAEAKGEDTTFWNKWAKGDRVVLANDPALYVRLYHGQNTWDREHILAARSEPRATTTPAPRSLARLVDRVRTLYPGDPKVRWLQVLPSIEGWANYSICRLLAGLVEWQQDNGIRGPLLEIGVHCGRSLAGMLAVSQDPVLAVDPFHAGGPEYWRMGRRELFEANMSQMFGGKLPERLIIWQGYSQELDREACLRMGAERFDFGDAVAAKAAVLSSGRLTAPAFRLAHIDGCHAEEHVRRDVGLCWSITAPQGLLALDDVCHHDYPGVALAVWPMVAGLAEPRLWPVAVAGHRLLAARSQAWADAYAKVIDQLAPKKGRRLVELAGRQVLVVMK